MNHTTKHTRLNWRKKNNNHATATAHPNPLACDSLFFASVSISLSLFLSLFFGVTLNTARFYSTSSVYSSLFFCPRNVVQFHNIFRWLGFFCFGFYNFGYSIHRCSFHPLLFTFVCSHNNNEQLLLAVIWFWVYISHSSFLYLSIIIIKKRDVYIRIWHSWLIYTKPSTRILSISYFTIVVNWIHWILKPSQMHIVISGSTSKLRFCSFFITKKKREFFCMTNNIFLEK